MSKKSAEQKIVENIIKKLGKEGVEYLMKHGEMPVLKLSAEEMNFIRGGGLTKVRQIIALTPLGPSFGNY